jgi:hypothetical protein
MVGSLACLKIEPLGYFTSLVLVQTSYLLALAPLLKVDQVEEAS